MRPVHIVDGVAAVVEYLMLLAAAHESEIGTKWMSRDVRRYEMRSKADISTWFF